MSINAFSSLQLLKKNRKPFKSAIPVYTAAGTAVTFTADSQVVSGATGAYAYANGTYVCLGSSANNAAYQATGFSTIDATKWGVAVAGQTNIYGSNFTQSSYTSTGLYQGGGAGGTTFSTTVSGVGALAGEWIQYKLPYALRLSNYMFYNRYTPRVPRDFWVVGSNDGITWYLLDTQTNQTTLGAVTFNITPTSPYNYFRFIINKTQSSADGYLEIQQVHFGGYL
jgi:hypothetical protein